MYLLYHRCLQHIKPSCVFCVSCVSCAPQLTLHLQYIHFYHGLDSITTAYICLGARDTWPFPLRKRLHLGYQISRSDKWGTSNRTHQSCQMASGPARSVSKRSSMTLLGQMIRFLALKVQFIFRQIHEKSWFLKSTNIANLSNICMACSCLNLIIPRFDAIFVFSAVPHCCVYCCSHIARIARADKNTLLRLRFS